LEQPALEVQSRGMASSPEDLNRIRSLYLGLTDEVLDEIRKNLLRYAEFAMAALDAIAPQPGE
jgi:hypothetical protein